MEITGIISAIVVGLIVGALGRLIVPGKQHLPIWLTLILGIVAAFIGGWIAAGIFGAGWIITLIIQVLVAAAIVYLADGFYSRGSRGAKGRTA
ncbi:GlsB/YeaQ/YmgE family stress response membrane protein [Nocardiopsis deserti]|uniref:GlsB/YeaQ/YmgE family stress response membrane protein n=1 Tax=Nocardiopsis deserti TaxID=2605988 RepID=UPI001238B579|nr:GlsB/YeaQ/YmgE family stress response membrane protein [Nocardiopsis deserti]